MSVCVRVRDECVCMSVCVCVCVYTGQCVDIRAFHPSLALGWKCILSCHGHNAYNVMIISLMFFMAGYILIEG
jgi:hypothetical protein